MRLWSIHPKYLDAKGLVALWREGLLAKNILDGHVRGYANHPQLVRFKMHKKPSIMINAYLYQVYLEAKRRGYKFSISKIEPITLKEEITVTKGQLEFEFFHFLKKLEKRNRKKFEELKDLTVSNIEPNPIFKIVDGGKEAWEKSK
ncbi:MAG: pyrimidine dimer DNA glycosylase/endonuclease V [Nitrososphaerota archaeon]|nr:pyrimidine dimer DNA glycosylase/endonuclease V [Candidatus Bathyarchaeota archaeon]MDW8022759.1 pyrimidine dimer DNA glycosylase/endonuclease V [Nitrososphaerota archaeon]